VSASAGAATVAVLPTEGGALCALADGRLSLFSPFTAPSFEPVPLDGGPLVRAAWVALGARLLVGFELDAKRLSVFTPEGDRVAVVVDPLLARHGEGAALVADPASEYLYLLGGEVGGAESDPTAITRVDLRDPAAPLVDARGSLPSPRWGGAAVWVTGRLASFHRILWLGGETDAPGLPDAFVVDVGDAGTVAALPSPLGVIGATALSLGDGQVLVVGGAASADVQRLVLEVAPETRLSLADPAPPPLALKRDAPRLVEYADGRVLVVGGVAAGDTVAAAEIVDLRGFPGEVVSTGALPPAVDAPWPALLGDESVWVFDPEGTYGYVPPR
jgi:hypothetical protein